MATTTSAVGQAAGAQRTGSAWDLARITQARVISPLAALTLLALVVVLPLVVMVVAAFRPPGVFPLETYQFTLDNFASVFGHPSTGLMLWNTVVYAVGSIVIALPFAFGLAFLTERTDLPGRSALYTIMFIPMSVPVFASALGWVLLLGPRAGTINVWIREILQLNIRNGPVNIFSMEGMIFVHALGIIPSMWLILISVLRSMDPSLEDAAAVSGAGRLSTIRHVTAPLMAPGLLAVVVLFTVSGLESLETPLALGKTAGVDVMALRVWDLLHLTTGQGFDYGPPAVLGLLGLAAGIVGIWLYLRFTRQASRYVVITGKGYRPRMVALGRWRFAAFGAVALYMLVAIVIPFVTLLATSFQKFYQPLVPGVEIAWTTTNYEQMFDFRFFGQYFLNTIIVSVAAATVTMLLVSFFAWQLVRWPSRLTRMVNSLAFMPLAIPGIISGLAFFLFFIGTPLYGTLILLVLAFTARFIAYGTRLMHSAQIQIHRELEEAAQTGGVSYLASFFHINLRLLLPAFINGWMWILTHAARDFTTPLMVASAGSLMASNIIYGRFSDGNYPISAAMMIALILFNVTVVLASRRWIVRAVGRSH